MTSELGVFQVEQKNARYLFYDIWQRNTCHNGLYELSPYSSTFLNDKGRYLDCQNQQASEYPLCPKGLSPEQPNKQAFQNPSLAYSESYESFI
jgi:hypothetical protein